MRKIFIDLNVVLDVLLARSPFLGTSQRLLDLVAKNKIKGYLSVASVLNLYYLVQKQLNAPSAREHVKKMIQLVSIVEIDTDILQSALYIPLADFEDSVQAACAQRCAAEYIITRNLKDFKDSPIQCLSPEKYLESYEDSAQR